MAGPSVTKPPLTGAGPRPARAWASAIAELLVAKWMSGGGLVRRIHDLRLALSMLHGDRHGTGRRSQSFKQACVVIRMGVEARRVSGDVMWLDWMDSRLT